MFNQGPPRQGNRSPRRYVALALYVRSAKHSSYLALAYPPWSKVAEVHQAELYQHLSPHSTADNFPAYAFSACDRVLPANATLLRPPMTNGTPRARTECSSCLQTQALVATMEGHHQYREDIPQRRRPKERHRQENTYVRGNSGYFFCSTSDAAFGRKIYSGSILINARTWNIGVQHLARWSVLCRLYSLHWQYLQRAYDTIDSCDYLVTVWIQLRKHLPNRLRPTPLLKGSRRRCC